MRPIFKGDIPKVNGVDKVVSDYKDWRQDLLDRIGNHCCYCNMVLNDSPQVEHVFPKSVHPTLRLAWNNMLLACGPCNRAKSNLPYDKHTHYIPDYHNTHLAFDYVVVPHPTKQNQMACITVPKANVNKATATIDLFKLDAVTSNPRATDLRWKYRYEAFISANLWYQNWLKWGYKVPYDFIELLKTIVRATGFFSIWFNVFDQVAEVKKGIIDSVPGTHSASFDSTRDYVPTVRVVGDL